jgi:hypothetical protein
MDVWTARPLSEQARMPFPPRRPAPPEYCTAPGIAGVQYSKAVHESTLGGSLLCRLPSVYKGMPTKADSLIKTHGNMGKGLP